MAVSVEELYGNLWRTPQIGFEQQLSRSLAPRGSGLLKEMFRDTGVNANQTVLDIGCRDATHAISLAQTFGCRVIGIDPIAGHIDDAARNIAEAGLGECVTVKQGAIEALPLAEATIDRIWCRDVLNHVDLPVALAECRRVLRLGGQLVVFQTLATDLLEPQEATRLFAALAIVPANMACDRFEQLATEAGFAILRKEIQGSESREHALENETLSFDQTLLHLCRMRRLEPEMVQHYGRDFYEAAYHSELWGIYQALGKLSNHIHVLERRR